MRNGGHVTAIEHMANHVLSEGLAAATLRPLAAAAGTSDRMLLYYFVTKDELLAATLERIAARMIAQLDAAIPVEPRRPFAVLLNEVWAAMAAENLQPFMPLWLELASGAARGLQPHRDIAGQIADGSWPGCRRACSRKTTASRRSRCSSRPSKECIFSRPSVEATSPTERPLSSLHALDSH